MKSNSVQRLICDVIRSQAMFWETTNDITSPTHRTDIDEECCAQLMDVIPDEDVIELAVQLKGLYRFIRKFDNYGKES